MGGGSPEGQLCTRDVYQEISCLGVLAGLPCTTHHDYVHSPLDDDFPLQISGLFTSMKVPSVL